MHPLFAKSTQTRQNSLYAAGRSRSVPVGLKHGEASCIITGEQICSRVPICKHTGNSVLSAANWKGQMRWLQQSGTSSHWNNWREQCFLPAGKSAACASHQLTRQKLGVDLTPGQSSSIASIMAMGMVLVLLNSFRSVSCAQRRKQNSSIAVLDSTTRRTSALKNAPEAAKQNNWTNRW